MCRIMKAITRWNMEQLIFPRQVILRPTAPTWIKNHQMIYTVSISHDSAWDVAVIRQYVYRRIFMNSKYR